MDYLARCVPFEIDGVKALHWLKKHYFEAALGALLAIGAWDVLNDIEQEKRLAIIETRLDHIDKAVNNVQPNQPTLREMVEEIFKQSQLQSP